MFRVAWCGFRFVGSHVACCVLCVAFSVSPFSRFVFCASCFELRAWCFVLSMLRFACCALHFVFRCLFEPRVACFESRCSSFVFYPVYVSCDAFGISRLACRVSRFELICSSLVLFSAVCGSCVVFGMQLCVLRFVFRSLFFALHGSRFIVFFIVSNFAFGVLCVCCISLFALHVSCSALWVSSCVVGVSLSACSVSCVALCTLVFAFRISRVVLRSVWFEMYVRNSPFV